MRVLEGLGFPFSPRAVGIAPAHGLLAARSVRWLRNRYTTFDLAHEIGEEFALLDPIAVASEAEC
jgi:hypothetical protein